MALETALNFTFSFKLTFLGWQQNSLLVDWALRATSRGKKKSLVGENNRKISNN